MKVVLASVGAKFSHKTLAAHCIKSYSDRFSPQCDVEIFESSTNEPAGDIITALYSLKPQVLGLSTYIWNTDHIKKISGTIKKILPQCIIVLGGPEISADQVHSEYPAADYFIYGPGEVAFSDLINLLSKGQRPKEKLIVGQNIEFESLPSPFTPSYFDSFGADKYGKTENKLIYYESSRGCPFSCAYCLSSAQKGVAYLPLARVREELALLVAKGAKVIKFVDRTFNLDKERSKNILEYIANLETDCTFHFEVAADLFDSGTLEIIRQMPPGRVQFEIGIQSTNERTLKAVNRKTDLKKAFENTKKLTALKNSHIHLDLIAGLPFESLESFAPAISSCLEVRPHMLQLGFLKVLKNTDIIKAYPEGSLLYNDWAPYEVLQSDGMTYEDLCYLKSIERVIDKFYNSGQFVNTLNFALEEVFENGYELFSNLAEFCQGIGDIKANLKRSYTMLFDFLKPRCNFNKLAHNIHLDCLTFDPKGSLPDEISPRRDKASERELKRKPEFKRKNIRVEDLELTGEKLLFVYDEKCPISKAYRIFKLEEKSLEVIAID